MIDISISGVDWKDIREQLKEMLNVPNVSIVTEDGSTVDIKPHAAKEGKKKPTEPKKGKSTPKEPISADEEALRAELLNVAVAAMKGAGKVAVQKVAEKYGAKKLTEIKGEDLQKAIDIITKLGEN